MTTHDMYIALGSIKDILLGISGGAVAYLFDYSKAKREGDDKFRFLLSSMLINMTLGAFVAYTVGSMLPADMSYRDAIIGFSGVTAYNIILLAESRFAEWLVNKLQNGTKDK